MDLGLKGKAAIVVGASRGIGKAIAEGLGEEGCRLLICARGEEQLQITADELRAKGVPVHAISMDITDNNAGELLAATARKVYGQIDILIGNAGGNKRKPLEETTDAEWVEILNLNLMAHVRCSRAVIPDMKKAGKGSMIFVSSIFGREAGGAGLSIYNTTKSALISMAKILAIELAPAGIRVNTVAPGSIRFPGGSWDKRCIEDPDGMAVFIDQNLPLGRFGRAEEVADVVTFLASERASLITGACITVDGTQSRSLI